MGFIWSASNLAWEKMLRELLAFSEEHGTVNVPERCAGHQKLANWVHSQRHRRKSGKLSATRVRQLDSIGFCWSMRDSGQTETTPGAAWNDDPELPNTEENGHEERLYAVGSGCYVQYGGSGRKPHDLASFIDSHEGEYPAYIPLPREEVAFYLGDRLHSGRAVQWSGSGPLPGEVMAFVRNNGTLPPHEPSNARGRRVPQFMKGRSVPAVAP